MECYDISHISGVDKVGSMVVFINGKKAPSEYRRFRIKTVEGAEDFACMAETLKRRVRAMHGGLCQKQTAFFFAFWGVFR